MTRVERAIAPHQSKIEAGLIILVGLWLGLEDQSASEVPGMLRFPAMIAALILVGQGLVLLDQARRVTATTASQPAQTPSAEASLPATQPTGVPVGAGAPAAQPPAAAPVNRGRDEAAEEDGAGGGTAARLVLVLAIWLALATLVYPDTPLTLTLLSLLAAYLLFARGWKLMVPNRG